MVTENFNVVKNIFTNSEIPLFVYDLIFALKNIQKIETVDSIHICINKDVLELYIFYDKENFDIEDKITKEITNVEETHKIFFETYIYPLDMIENKKMQLPDNAKEF